MSGWYETLSSEVEYEHGFFRVRMDTVRMPDGSEVERGVVEVPDAVGVLPVMDDGSVVLVRQYRHPLGRHLLEIPAGKLDIDGEGVEEAAQRELIEEVGLRADRLEHLVTFANSAGGVTERTFVYVGRGMVSADAPDGFVPKAEEAAMEIVRLPLDVAVAQARSGAIEDAKTLIALLAVDAATASDGSSGGGGADPLGS